MNKIIFFLSLIIFFAIPIHAQFVSDSNTLALWHMDEGGISAITADSSGNSRTLNVTGTDWTNTGRFGKGLHFNQSTSAVAILQNNPVNFPANMPFAIDGFVKINKNGKLRFIFLYFIPAESFSRLIEIVVLSDGTVRCDLRVDSQGGSAPLQQAFGKAIDDGQWHRITCTRSVGNTRLLLYIDNLLEDNATGNNGAVSGTQLSFSRDTPNEGLDGELDEWRIMKQTVYPKESDFSGTALIVNNLTTNNTNFSTSNPSFAFNVTSFIASSNINISLFIDGVYNRTTLLINNNTNGTISGASVSNGLHYTMIQATDPFGNSANMSDVLWFRVNVVVEPPCNCTNLTQKVEELKQRIGELENRVNDAENRLGVAESQLIDSENKISDLESKLNDSENKISDLESKLNDSENKVNDLESRLGDAESKITDFDNELRATNNKLDILENKLNNTTSSFESLKLRVDAVFGYLKNLLLPIKKEMVCGYMKDNKLTKHEALGLKCRISRNNCICSIA